MHYIRVISLFNSLLLSANVAAAPAVGYQVYNKLGEHRNAREPVFAQKIKRVNPIELVCADVKIAGNQNFYCTL